MYKLTIFLYDDFSVGLSQKPVNTTVATAEDDSVVNKGKYFSILISSEIPEITMPSLTAMTACKRVSL